MAGMHGGKYGRGVIDPTDGAPHPGHVLRDSVLRRRKLRAYDLAKAMHVTEADLQKFLDGKTPVTPWWAEQLGRALGDGAELWLSRQARYDEFLAREAKEVKEEENGSAE